MQVNNRLELPQLVVVVLVASSSLWRTTFCFLLSAFIRPWQTVVTSQDYVALTATCFFERDFTALLEILPGEPLKSAP